ncbi:MAG: NlpC/P60 family protein [Negativicutes bacterium]|nr:NlpC/P60 family protein [Negativicutes bacterium]
MFRWMFILAIAGLTTAVSLLATTGGEEGKAQSLAPTDIYTVMADQPPGGSLIRGQTSPAMLNAGYWLKEVANPEKVLLTGEQIARLNRRLAADADLDCHNLLEQPQQFQVGFIRRQITGCADQGNGLTDSSGRPITRQEIDSLLAGCLPEGEKVSANYGFTVASSDLRALPSDRKAIRGNPRLDRWQLTHLDPGQPLIVLAASVDGKWLFVMSDNYCGWLPAANVGLTDRTTWRNIINGRQFLVVTAPRLKMQNGNGRLLTWQMGAKIMLRNTEDGDYVVKIPARDSDGRLYWQYGRISRTSDLVSSSYLPYTRANQLKQAFRYLGYPYGWGGQLDSVDCSALVLNVYRAFGIFLPRDADRQEEAVAKGIIRAVSWDSALPGDLLYMNKGHAMIYLGKSAGRPFAIHSATSYGSSVAAEGQVEAWQVVVSDLGITNSAGTTYRQAVTAIGRI